MLQISSMTKSMIPTQSIPTSLLPTFSTKPGHQPGRSDCTGRELGCVFWRIRDMYYILKKSATCMHDVAKYVHMMCMEIHVHKYIYIHTAVYYIHLESPGCLCTESCGIVLWSCVYVCIHGTCLPANLDTAGYVYTYIYIPITRCSLSVILCKSVKLGISSPLRQQRPIACSFSFSRFF